MLKATNLDRSMTMRIGRDTAFGMNVARTAVWKIVVPQRPSTKSCDAGKLVRDFRSLHEGGHVRSESSSFWGA